MHDVWFSIHNLDLSANTSMRAWGKSANEKQCYLKDGDETPNKIILIFNFHHLLIICVYGISAISQPNWSPPLQPVSVQGKRLELRDTQFSPLPQDLGSPFPWKQRLASPRGHHLDKSLGPRLLLSW